MQNEKTAQAAGFLSFFIIALPLCSAFTGTSASYNMNISNINYAAYDGHSNNYNIDFSLVEQYVGSNETVNYNVSYGFYKGVDYTGYSVGGPCDISIDAPATVTVSTTATATVELTNQNPDFGEDAILDYWITNSSGDTLISGSKTVYVGALSTVETSVSLTAPSATGSYNYRARVTWSSTYIATSHDGFSVTEAATGDGSGDDGGGEGSGAISGISLRITEYPKTMTVEQEGFTQGMIEVSNHGADNATGTFLVVQGLNEYCWISVNPESINIEEGKNESFILKIKPKSGALPGSYYFTIKAISGSIETSAESTLQIIESVAREISIKDITTQPDKFILNESGKLQIIVQNTGDESINVSIRLSVPESVEIEEANITKHIAAGVQEVFEFSLLPKKTGIYEVNVIMSYESREVIRSALVAVESPKAEETQSVLYIIIMLIASCVAFAVISIWFIDKMSKGE